MKVEQLNIHQWAALMERYKKTPGYRPGAAMRIENTLFTPARHYGGMRHNGDSYTYFEPVIPEEPVNQDGAPYVAWLMVRDDFLRWVKKELKTSKKGGAE